jgi:hypothetical protein
LFDEAEIAKKMGRATNELPSCHSESPAPVILSPSLAVILNEVKNLATLRVDSAKDLQGEGSERFFVVPMNRDSSE